MQEHSKAYYKPVLASLCFVLRLDFTGGVDLVLSLAKASSLEPCCENGSDQLPQDAGQLPDAPWGALSAVVDAAGSDPGDPPLCARLTLGVPRF